MIDKMVRDKLRRGDFSRKDERVRRIEELVNEHRLETKHERELLLLAAMLLEGGGDTRVPIGLWEDCWQRRRDWTRHS